MKTRDLFFLIVKILIAVTMVAYAGSAAVFADEDTPDTPAVYADEDTSDTPAVSADEGTSETPAVFEGYIHDPMENPVAAREIIVDPDAVYGYSPSPDTVRLTMYLRYDFKDPAVVNELRDRREEYHESIRELYQMILDMKAVGKSTEEIARAVINRRNEIRIESYKDDLEGLEKLKQSNLDTYGDENGPTPEFLYDKYGSWEMVMSKALSSNPGADACVGLYDKYYNTYILDDGREWSKDGNYYVLNGVTYDKYEEAVNGVVEIDGDVYYFAKGLAETGVVKYDGKLYYFGKSGKGRAKKGWFKGTDKKKRYSLGKGRIASGVKKVGKTYYYFRKKNGTLQKKGFFKSGKKEYYSKGGGKLATGWKAIGKKACYFYPKGKKACQMAKNTKIGYLKIPKSGRLGEAYALGIKALNKHGWSLRSAYKFSYRLRYYGRWYRTSSSEKYSLRGFKAHHGNCYVMAATFYIQAKLLGYNVHQVRGHVGVWPHSWTVIKHGKKYYVYDPNFRNETGRNGWKIWYGKRGTWRYSGKHWMN